MKTQRTQNHRIIGKTRSNRIPEEAEIVVQSEDSVLQSSSQNLLFPEQIMNPVNLTLDLQVSMTILPKILMVKRMKNKYK